MAAHEGGGDLFGAIGIDQGAGEFSLIGRGIFGEDRVSHQARIIERVDFVRRRRFAPAGFDLGIAQKALDAAAGTRGDQQGADALAARAACAARAVQQGGRIAWQVGVDDEAEVLEIQAAGGDVGRDTDAGTSIAQGLERVAAFLLAQFPRQGDNREAAIAHAADQLVDGGAGRAEHDGCFAVGMADNVDDGILFIAGGDQQGAVFNIDMLLLFGGRGDAHGIFLVTRGEGGDALGHGGREHQGAAGFRRAFENVFEFLAEAHVEHFIGLVQHDDADVRGVQRTATDMV